jgi:hypothetical protein
MAPKHMLAGVPPNYRTEDIRDEAAFYSKLLTEGEGPESTPSRLVWSLLPEAARDAAREAVAGSQESKERYARIVAALNAALEDRSLHEPDEFEGITLPSRAQELAERDRASLTHEQVLHLNRAALEAVFPRAVGTHKRGVMRLGEGEIVDWQGFCSRLKGLARRRKANPGKTLWRLLPEDAHGAVEATLEAGRRAEERNATVVAALNDILKRADLFQSAELRETALPKEAEELLKRTAEARALGSELKEATDAAAAAATEKQKAAAQKLREVRVRVSGFLDGEELEEFNRHLIDVAYKGGLRSIGASRDYVLNGFLHGLAVGTEHISPSKIPWYAWTRPLLFWLPLLIAISVGMIGLAVVVHRQWSDHEHLPYPIVTFAHALLPTEGKSRGGVFRNRLFWGALIVVLAIHMNNYAYAWWPRYLIPVPRRFDFMSLRDVLPRLANPGHLLNPTLSFTAIGFAYFLATDVSLSVGLAPFVYEWVAGLFLAYGVSFTGGGFLSLQIQTFLFGGAYFGMFLVLLYTGRHYYTSVLRSSFFLPARDKPERQAVWGARVFLAGFAFFAGQLMLVGVTWYLALLYTAGAIMILVVISRLVAETGVFFIHAYHFPCVLLWGFLGARVIGPQALLPMLMVSSLLLIDPRESVMPYMVQGLKLADMNKAKVGRTAGWGCVALLVAFAVAVPVTLFWQYDRGAMQVGDGWTQGVPRMAFNGTVRAKERLKAQGVLEEAGNLSGMDWVRGISPNTPCVIAFGATFTLVVLFATARLRFPRWPFHPVMFLVLGAFQSRTLAVSFLIGWFIKVVVTKYGGAKAYHRLKPLMIGVIAGDMLGGLLPMVIGFFYYLVTGEPPKRFVVLPL